MKNLLLIAAVSFAATAQADEKSTAILNALGQEVASWGDYRVEFSVSSDGRTTTGQYEVSGNRYRIQTPDVQMVSDGVTRWEIDRLEKTIAIDAVDPADHSVLSNPTRLFDFPDGSYTHRMVGAAMIDGVSCNRLELKDTQTGDTIEAYISTAGRPVRLVYALPFLDSGAVIDVLRITPRASIDKDFRPADHPDFEIIDFR